MSRGGAPAGPRGKPATGPAGGPPRGGPPAPKPGGGPPAPRPGGGPARAWRRTRRRAELRECGIRRDECDAEQHARGQDQKSSFRHTYVLRSRGLVGRRWLPLARPPTGKRSGAGRGFDRRPVLGRRPATARLARCSRLVRGKSSENEFRYRAGGTVDPATQAARQLAHDPQAATKPDPSKARAVVGDAAVDPGAGTHQLDFDFTISAIEAGMADRVRHQLVDGQRQAPAPLRLQRQRFSRQYKADVHAIQLATAHRQSQLAKLFAGVHKRVAIRHCQDAVDLDMLVEQVDDIAQLFLGVDVVRPDRL